MFIAYYMTFDSSSLSHIRQCERERFARAGVISCTGFMLRPAPPLLSRQPPLLIEAWLSRHAAYSRHASHSPQPRMRACVSARLAATNRPMQALRSSHASSCTPAGETYSSSRAVPPGERCVSLCARDPRGVTSTCSCSCPGSCPPHSEENSTMSSAWSSVMAVAFARDSSAGW